MGKCLHFAIIFAENGDLEGHVFYRLKQFKAAFFSQHTAGGVQRITGGGIRGNNGARNSLGEPQSGLRINDVRPAFACQFHELMQVA